MSIQYQIHDSRSIRLKQLPNTAFIYDLKNAIKSQSSNKLSKYDPEDLVLQVTDENNELVTLDDNMFEEKCMNDFNILIEKYSINRKHLLEVITPEKGMLEF